MAMSKKTISLYNYIYMAFLLYFCASSLYPRCMPVYLSSASMPVESPLVCIHSLIALWLLIRFFNFARVVAPESNEADVATVICVT